MIHRQDSLKSREVGASAGEALSDASHSYKCITSSDANIDSLIYGEILKRQLDWYQEPLEFIKNCYFNAISETICSGTPVNDAHVTIEKQVSSTTKTCERHVISIAILPHLPYLPLVLKYRLLSRNRPRVRHLLSVVYFINGFFINRGRSNFATSIAHCFTAARRHSQH